MVSLRKKVAFRRSAAALTAAVLLLSGALLGCGSDDDESSSGGSSSTTAGEASQAVTKAKRDVAVAREPIAEIALPADPPGPIPPNKRIAIIRAIAAPLPTRAAEGTKIAVEAVGWTGNIIDGGGNPQGWQDAINRAITDGVDGIVAVAMPTQIVQPAIERANQEGIPVVGALGEFDVRTKERPPGLANAFTSKQFEEGYRLGQWVVQDSPDGAKAIVLNQPEIKNLQRVSDGFKKAIADAGPDYEIVAEADSPLSDIQGPKGAQRMAALMRSNPDAKYMMTLSETWFGGFQQAAKLVNRDDVTALGSDGDFAVPLIQQGAQLVMIGPDTLMYGWYAVDALIRAFNDEPQPEYVIPYQLVDPANAKDVKGKGITATVDYPAEWMKLWKGQQ